MCKQCANVPPKILGNFKKKFCFTVFKEKLKFGFDFPTYFVLTINSDPLGNDVLCNAITDNHYHVIPQCFAESHKGQTNVIWYPANMQLTLY